MPDHKELILNHGLELAIKELCESDDLIAGLRGVLLQKEAYSIGGKSINFTEDEVSDVMRKLEDAILTLALSSYQCDKDQGERPPEDVLPAKSSHSRLRAAQEVVPPIPTERVIHGTVDLSEEIPTGNMIIGRVRFDGKELQVDGPQSLIEQMIYPLLLRRSNSVEEDLVYIKEHTGLEASRDNRMLSKRFSKSKEMGIYLPVVDVVTAIRIAHKIARILGGALSIVMIHEGKSRVTEYTYDPVKVRVPGPHAEDDPVFCGPGRVFRFSYLDTGDTMTFYIQKAGQDMSAMPSDVKVIGDGQPISQAVNGYGAGDVVSLELPGMTTRDVKILEVW